MTNGAERRPVREAGRGSPTLFERVTGTGRAARARAKETLPMAEPTLPRTAAASPVPSASPAPPAPQREVAEMASLGPLNPTDRLVASQAEEDLLDIPTFLRRQAN